MERTRDSLRVLRHWAALAVIIIHSSSRQLLAQLTGIFKATFRLRTRLLAAAVVKNEHNVAMLGHTELQGYRIEDNGSKVRIKILNSSRNAVVLN